MLVDIEILVYIGALVYLGTLTYIAKKKGSAFRQIPLWLFVQKNYFWMNLSFARVHLRSEELKRAWFFSYFWMNFLPFWITTPL